MRRALAVLLPRRLLALAIADASVTAITLLLAWAVWYSAMPGQRLAAAVLKVALVALVVIVCLHYYDLYESRIAGNPKEAVPRLSQVMGTACIILALLYYAVPRARLRAETLVGGVLVVGAALALDRRMFAAINHSPRLAQRVVIMGGGPFAADLAAAYARRPELAVRVLGYVGGAGEPASMPYLGGPEELLAVAERHHATGVVLALEEGQPAVPWDALMALKARGVDIQSAAEEYERATGKVALQAQNLRSWLSLDFGQSRRRRWQRRVCAIALAAAALALVWPLMLIVALVIRLDSPGPALFRQTRIGQDGKPFTLYKFRSMHVGADADGAVRPVVAGDARLTRVGRRIRRCRLDELPQLWNILRGDLHIVGPRPFVPEQELALAEEIPFYRLRWLVQPGATGWAQVQHGYCATLADNTEKLALDLFYIKHLSLSLDFIIVLQTLKILVLGRGAR